ncbi:hypothetical protein CDO44_02615 [Pigmentiphaga sp. NML080357]|nr:hypothetical protein CDO44_02615 [Pigmentiphaga sp. NML080357]
MLHGEAIEVGDVVYLQPVHGPLVASTVIFAAPLFGCTTYTADALVPAPGTTSAQRLRLRFRGRDVHRVQSQRRSPASAARKGTQ